MFRLITAALVLATLPVLTLDANAQERIRGNAPTTTEKPAESEFGGGIVQDPSFEAGSPNPFWDEASASFGTPLCNFAGCGNGGGTAVPRTGDWFVWFGGIGSGDVAHVEQTVTIPAGSANLKFWVRIPASGQPGFMRVRMDGAQLFEVTQADAGTYANYAEVTLNVNAYADGGAHVLRFESTTTAGAGTTNILVDDVTIEAAPAGPSLSVSPATVPFGGVQTGTTTAPQTVTLTNNGGAPVTITSITGSGAPFAVNTSGTSMTLAPGASTTFTVTFSPTATGPATGTVTIVSNAPGSPHTVNLTGTGENFLTYASTDTPLAIPDNTTAGGPGVVTSTITVPAGAPMILDLDVRLGITHSWVGDLMATVAHGATSAAIVDRPGVPASINGCSANNMNIILDDEGSAGAVETACVGLGSGVEAYTAGGRYTPNNPLSVFDGPSATGVWTLTITDNAGGDTGTLNSWALLVTPDTPVSNEGGPEAGAFRLAVAPNPVVGSGQATLVVPTAQDVRVVLYDALGRQVRVLFEGAVAAGQQAYIAFTTSGLAPGAYVLRASGEGVEAVQRVTVAR